MAYLDAFTKMVNDIKGMDLNAKADNVSQSVTMSKPGKMYEASNVKAKREPAPRCTSSLSMRRSVMMKRTAEIATISVPIPMSARPAMLPSRCPGGSSVRLVSDGAAISRNRSNFSPMKPKAIEPEPEETRGQGSGRIRRAPAT